MVMLSPETSQQSGPAGRWWLTDTTAGVFLHAPPPDCTNLTNHTSLTTTTHTHPGFLFPDIKLGGRGRSRHPLQSDVIIPPWPESTEKFSEPAETSSHHSVSGVLLRNFDPRWGMRGTKV